jgi:hypothetical protein
MLSPCSWLASSGCHDAGFIRIIGFIDFITADPLLIAK